MKKSKVKMDIAINNNIPIKRCFYLNTCHIPYKQCTDYEIIFILPLLFITAVCYSQTISVSSFRQLEKRIL